MVSDHSMFATPLQIELQDECISEVCPKSRCGVLAKEPASGMLSLRLQRSRVAKAPGRLRCPFHGAHQQVGVGGFILTRFHPRPGFSPWPWRFCRGTVLDILPAGVFSPLVFCAPLFFYSAPRVLNRLHLD
ncbi:unnamed protein product [Prorocentrum cordatum]|uniref:Uncharacterized protein n=1 Tax=Prorocentrum cordatum TaxID=2364126 RepID=A0ABN9XWM6_9DINO|nr:unnamed protein product [Polarella glacialis]